MFASKTVGQHPTVVVPTEHLRALVSKWTATASTNVQRAREKLAMYLDTRRPAMLRTFERLMEVTPARLQTWGVTLQDLMLVAEPRLTLEELYALQWLKTADDWRTLGVTNATQWLNLGQLPSAWLAVFPADDIQKAAAVLKPNQEEYKARRSDAWTKDVCAVFGIVPKTPSAHVKSGSTSALTSPSAKTATGLPRKAPLPTESLL